MEKLERFLFLAKYLLLKRITPSSHPRHVIPHHSIVNRKRVLYDTSLEIDGKTKFKSITHLRYYNTAMINENTVTTKSTSTLVTSLFNILQKKVVGYHLNYFMVQVLIVPGVSKRAAT